MPLDVIRMQLSAKGRGNLKRRLRGLAGQAPIRRWRFAGENGSRIKPEGPDDEGEPWEAHSTERARLQPRDRRLRHAHAPCQLPLRKAHIQATRTYEVADRVHALSKRVIARRLGILVKRTSQQHFGVSLARPTCRDLTPRSSESYRSRARHGRQGSVNRRARHSTAARSSGTYDHEWHTCPRGTSMWGEGCHGTTSGYMTMSDTYDREGHRSGGSRLNLGRPTLRRDPGPSSGGRRAAVASRPRPHRGACQRRRGAPPRPGAAARRSR